MSDNLTPDEPTRAVKRVRHFGGSEPMGPKTTSACQRTTPVSNTPMSSELPASMTPDSYCVYEKDYICRLVKETVENVIGDSWYSPTALMKWPDIVSETVVHSLVKNHDGNRYIGSLLCFTLFIRHCSKSTSMLRDFKLVVADAL